MPVFLVGVNVPYQYAMLAGTASLVSEVSSPELEYSLYEFFKYRNK